MHTLMFQTFLLAFHKFPSIINVDQGRKALACSPAFAFAALNQDPFRAGHPENEHSSVGPYLALL